MSSWFLISIDSLSCSVMLKVGVVITLFWFADDLSEESWLEADWTEVVSSFAVPIIRLIDSVCTGESCISTLTSWFNSWRSVKFYPPLVRPSGMFLRSYFATGVSICPSIISLVIMAAYLLNSIINMSTRASHRYSASWCLVLAIFRRLVIVAASAGALITDGSGKLISDKPKLESCVILFLIYY